MKIEINGISFLLFALFTILKLTGVIHWSWWLVTMPLWIWLIFCLIIAFITCLFVACKDYF